MRRKAAIYILAGAAVLAAVGLLLFGGRGRRPEDAGAGRDSLMLYCGAGIRPVASVLIEAFEKKTGTELKVNYGGSGLQLGQLSVAKKGDLFMPGAELYVDIAVEKGLADAATKRTVMRFIPVIFVEKGNPSNIRSVEDFTRDGLKIGLGDERSCAVGRKALKILDNHGLTFADVERNVVFKSGTVSELAVAIQLGTLDVVIVWDAVAKNFAESGTAVPIPPEKNSISIVPIVRLKSAKNPEQAERFIDFVTSPEGRKILLDCGYTLPAGVD